MIWKPNVTVAAVLEGEGKFLLVEEETDEGIRFNQPAGHLECRESLTDAVIGEEMCIRDRYSAPGQNTATLSGRLMPRVASVAVC